MDCVIELIPDDEQRGFTARLPDVPAYGEGETEDEAIADLRDSLRGYVLAFGLDDLTSRVCQPSLCSASLDLMALGCE